ncbi:GNAT family N-acetyltransferase [Nocardia colli]|uniref:GNAT family N-acetyltransferase n=1 Tax=Nocardia colli TaxID=2545717 RepID=A0A5N0EB70_9NOCA|nr:GNAT family N-acetyltransferase [Nocardia colli]
MPLPSGVCLRSATPEDEPAVHLLMANAFGGLFQQSPEVTARRRLAFPIERGLLAVVGERIVGHVTDRAMTLTIPDGRTIEACGINGVVVVPTHRRRGILRAMYTEQHRRTEDAGLALTILNASSATIYGRFGYGPAILENRVAIDRRFAEFRSTVADSAEVELTRFDAAFPLIAELHNRWRQRIPGCQHIGHRGSTAKQRFRASPFAGTLVAAANFLRGHRHGHSGADADLPREVTQLRHDFLLVGGKCLRPLLCVIGWRVGRNHVNHPRPRCCRFERALDLRLLFAERLWIKRSDRSRRFVKEWPSHRIPLLIELLGRRHGKEETFARIDNVHSSAGSGRHGHLSTRDISRQRVQGIKHLERLFHRRLRDPAGMSEPRQLSRGVRWMAQLDLRARCRSPSVEAGQGGIIVSPNWLCRG